MNILYLLSQVPQETGSGIYTRALIAQALRAGHRCSLVAAWSAENPPEVGTIGTDLIFPVIFNQEPLAFPVPGMSDVMPYPSSRFADLDSSQIQKYEHSFAQAIQRAVKKTRPDLIHSNHLWIMSALARRLFPQIPIVVSCHGTDLRQFRNCPHLHGNLLRYLPNADGIFALTQNQKKEITDLFGVDGRKIHVAPNGFDPDIFFPAPKPPAPPFMLLYAGKLSFSKGVPLLLECLESEKMRHQPIHLHLAGSGAGPEEAHCRALAQRLAGKITFCGPLMPRDLGDMMRKSHLFVLPSFFEGLPLVLIEALACGCRIVATDLPGIRELVSGLPGEWGQLVDLPPLETVDRPFAADLPFIRDNLAQALESQINKLMRKEPPPPNLSRLLKENVSWERVFKRMESIYKTIT